LIKGYRETYFLVGRYLNVRFFTEINTDQTRKYESYFLVDLAYPEKTC